LALTTPEGGRVRGAGPATGGITGPPITWRIVSTTVLCLACPCSHLSTLPSMDGVVPRLQFVGQMSWIVKMTHPPPCFRAPRTIDS
jgi:hypothetical protein